MMPYGTSTATATAWLRNRAPALQAKRASKQVWINQVRRIMADPKIRADYPKLKAERVRFYLDPIDGEKPSVAYLKRWIIPAARRELTKSPKSPTKSPPMVSAFAPKKREPRVVFDPLDGFRDPEPRAWIEPEQV